MPRVVFLNPPSNVPGKRKRMPGTDSTQKPEVKMMRCLSLTQTTQTMYERFIMHNVFLRADIQNHICGSWCPVAIRLPGQGVNGNQRVGNQIFLKYLRLKGYVSTYNNCGVSLHWRLRLIRSDNQITENYGDNKYDTANHYLDKVYRSPMHYNAALTAGGMRDYACYNYFCNYKNMDTKDELKVKTIASGVINRNYAATKASHSQNGTGSDKYQGIITTFPFAPTDFCGCTKLDVTVDLFDTIHFNLKTTAAGHEVTQDVAYLLCLEVDIPFGLDVSQTLPNYVQQTSFDDADRLFDLNFNSILYFTDI